MVGGFVDQEMAGVFEDNELGVGDELVQFLGGCEGHGIGVAADDQGGALDFR